MQRAPSALHSLVSMLRYQQRALEKMAVGRAGRRARAGVVKKSDMFYGLAFLGLFQELNYSNYILKPCVMVAFLVNH